MSTLNPTANSAAIAAALCKAEEAGFKWYPCKDAPNTYKALREAYKRGSVPVSNVPVESCIYATPEDNVKARALHDYIHLMRGLDFSLASELKVAECLLHSVRDAGADWDTTRAIALDTAAQAHYYALTKTYVRDQLAFVQDTCTHGLAAMLRRIESGWRY